MATVTVHVSPRSAKEGVAGFSAGVLRIRLTAPPVENRANEALVRFLSEALGVPRRQVELVTGEKGRNKVVRIRGISRGEVFRRLGLRLEQPPD
ncbi:MAG: YggU family protein [Deltaproteobacteria bacterium]|nr:YggU family protein [Deltaproteobacteria bacterium]